MVERIVSGGQTGVDRAGLDFAIEQGIPHGGFCPKGRRAENGRIPDKYQLAECASPEYPMRTTLNVVHSDGTLVLTRGTPEGGTRRTVEVCMERNKPRFVVDLRRPLEAEAFAKWVAVHGIRTLNIAGPRESKCSGIGKEAKKALRILFAALKNPQALA